MTSGWVRQTSVELKEGRQEVVMENGSSCGSFRQSMPRLRGGQWASEHCVQKVEEMLSRAIVHQEDLLGLLTSENVNHGHHRGHHNNSSSSSASPEVADSISPPVLRALKAKIENSMDWCHLALCRLREIVLHTSNNHASPSPRSVQHSMGSSGGHGHLSSYSKPASDGAKQQQHQQLVNSSPKQNVPTPLSPLRVLLRKEPLSPHPFTAQGQWNPGHLLFTDLPPPGFPPGEDSSSQQQQRRHQQQEQNFARLPASLHMDTSDWPLLQSETGPMSAGLPLPLLSSAADPRQCSSSCQINPVVGSYNGEVTDHLHYKTHVAVVAEDQSYINKTPTPLLRGNRSRNGSGKSEVRKLSGGEAKLEVVFQKLNDAKKGIPDDGHRGWKKYGNKSIQNSNHCRGYYKCSVKECRAKKMVQPTDKDPTLFEVTYVGKHSCSSTGQRKRSSRSTPSAPVEAPEGKNKNCGGMEMEDSSILTASNSVTEESIRENSWTGIIPGKRGRSIVEPEEKASLNNFSYLHTMTTSSASEDREQVGDAGDASMDTYLHQGSRHHQAVYSFQEPLLWHDFDMDTNLSTGHKSVSMDSDSP